MKINKIFKMSVFFMSKFGNLRTFGWTEMYRLHKKRKKETEAERNKDGQIERGEGRQREGVTDNVVKH